MSQAFINFFEGRAKFPRFKAKHHKQSISYPQNVKITEGYIKFPKLKLVSAQISQTIQGKIKTVTVSQVPSGKYYASILVDDETDKPEISSETGLINCRTKFGRQPLGKVIGLDVGITDICVTSDGSKYNNPCWFKKHQKNLKRKQQKLARQQKGSTNRSKAGKLAAKVYGNSNSHFEKK
ncbi:transposase, partial [Hyella patelloides]|uniref:RNA-guided endonuclease InsQ/TnpB family protein n=1 Tax=Hyella patelloides TaxID=1982969 RepID=UPI001FE9B8BC